MGLTDEVTRHDPASVACIENGHPYSYGDLCDRAGDVRSFLVGKGIGPGDRVSIAASSEYSFACCLLGILGIGAVAVPTNPMSPPAEMQRMLGPLTPSLVIAGAMAKGMLDYGAGSPAPVVAFDSIPTQSGPSSAPITECSPDQLALLMMTSGTAGPPKAAMLTHGNLGFTLGTLTSPELDGIKSDDVALCCLPTAHIFGLMAIAAVLQQGATAVLRDRFNAEATLALIRDHRITTVAGAPLMWRRWARVDTKGDNPMASVRRALSGAATLTREVFESVHERFGVDVFEGYGMTETTSLISTTLGHPPRPSSVGPPVPGVEVMLVDPDGTVVDPGDTGEVVVRGAGVFTGYYDDDEATSEVLTDDGWLWTGDLAARDDDGYLFIVDRIKNVINVSGFNVYPAEVESVLLEHPKVTLAAVAGGTDVDMGESVVAYVIGTADPVELASFAADRLASYKRPNQFRMVDELPLTAAGKIVRRDLA